MGHSVFSHISCIERHTEHIRPQNELCLCHACNRLRGVSTQETQTAFACVLGSQPRVRVSTMNPAKSHHVNGLLSRWAMYLWSCLSRHARAWDSISLVKKKIWICPAPITYYHKSIQFHLPPHLYPHVWHNYQIPHVHTPCAIDPGRALSYPLSIHQPGPSPSPSRPFISIGMREVNQTHLMGLCVSRKWMARVSHWPCRWATRCCPRWRWCRRRCRRSSGELQRIQKVRVQHQHFQFCKHFSQGHMR